MNAKNISVLKKCVLFLVLFASVSNLNATHIIGGEMNYTCLGDDNYEIELTIYRDCFYGNPNAFFDNPAYIGVFNANNQLVGNLQLPLLNNDTIPAVLNDPCLFVPADVCVHTTTYRGVINLPFVAGGYQLAYERCCRNETILNIVDPLNAGAIYNTFITEEAMQQCNSSARFTEWPPLFVCVNEPIDWDHSAFDIDGDSLVYSLCTPLSGGSQADPKPVPTNNPPYDNVIWNDPAYNLDNLLGGVPLTIDRQTGRLTAIPGIMGQFVIGVCVEEFRDGVMISQTRRDFQYNVGECGMVESAIVAPTVQCEDLSVSFVNESLNSDGYQWNFNDPNNPGASSTDAEPTYTYSEPGTYTIELIASTREVCTDTSYHTILLQRNSMETNFSFDVQNCVDNSTIVLQDLSVDPISNPATWSWSLSENGVVTQSSDAQNPMFAVSTPADIQVSLTTTSENGCVDADSKAFETEIFNPGDQIASDIEVCIGTDSELNPGSANGFEYQWEPNDLFSDLTSPNPEINITENAQLQVTITATNGGCVSTKTVNLSARSIPEVNDLQDEFTICNGTAVQLNQIEYPGLEFEWNGSAISDTNSDTPTVNPSADEMYTVSISEVGGLSCSVEQTINVIVNDTPDPQLGLVNDQSTICIGTSASLNPNGDASFDYTWNGVGLNNVTTLNPSIEPTNSSNYSVIVTNPTTGCTSEKTISIVVPADIDLRVEGDQSICFNTQTTLQALGTGNLTFQWNNEEGTIMSSEAVLEFSQNDSEQISLLATNDEGCQESILVNVDVADRVDALDNLPDSVLVCENIPTSLSSSANDQFDFLWSPAANLDDVTSSIPVFTSDETTIYTVEATNPANGCKVQRSLRAVVPSEIDLNISDDISTCGDEAVVLNASSTNGESYTWIQSTGAPIGTGTSVTVDPRISAQYLVEVVDEFGCFVSDSVNVNFIGVTANIAEDNEETCDDEVQLALSDINSNNTNTYTWGPAESIISGANDANPIVVNNTNDPITFTVAITNQNGCVVQDQLILANRFEIDDIDRAACADIDLDLNPNFNRDLDYSWGPSGLLSDPDAPNPSYTPTTDQLFTVTVTDADGCTTIRDVQVNTVDLNDMVDIDIESDTILDGEETQINVTFDPDFSYLWIPPTSLSDNTVSNPIANPSQTTNYNVMITNSQGCVATKSVTLNVLSSDCSEPFVFFPNAFTPNGDGINDVLRVRGNALSEVRFIIYDRWGERVFETNSIDGAWDGTYKGKQLAPDVYGYYLEAKCIFGGEFKKQGNVTLLD